MRRLVMCSVVLIGFGVLPGHASALPAPMSQEQLLEKSDLVALVRIKSVTCTGVSKDDRTGEDLPNYSARAELIEVIKGEDVKGDTVNINFHAIPTQLLGPWTVYYYPGEMVCTHLVGADGEYTTTWWNGRGDVVRKAVIAELPTKPGETVEILKGGKRHIPSCVLGGPMRQFRFLSLLILACLAVPAFALPAPMTEQELMEKSDVVALMRVVSVTCTSVTKNEQTGEELPGYLAKLQVKEVKKGDVKPGEEVLVTWRAVPKSIVGPWTVYYYPGEEMVTHLTKRSGGVSYASTWWNAKGDDTKSPDTRDLPTTSGETVVPRPEPAVQTPL